MGSNLAQIVFPKKLFLLFALAASLGVMVAPADGTDRSLLEAAARYDEGNWRSAVKLYQEDELSLEPSDLIRYGEALSRLGQHEQAESVLGRAETESEPADEEVVLRSRAARYFIDAQRGKPELAISRLEALVAEKPGAYWPHLYLGRALKAAQRREDALAELYEAAAIVPRRFWAYFEIGEIYEQLFLFDLAMDAYEEALYYNPRYAQAINNLGYCYKEKSVLYPGVTLYSYAVDKYLEAIEIQPDNAGFYYNVGNAYTHLGKLDRAFEAYSRAVQLDPTFAKAHYNLGRTWQRFRKLDKAIKEFELYLKYGNQAIFDFVQQPEVVRAEIEAMQRALEQNGSDADN